MGIEDSLIRYNTSDGLDFLYISEPGSSIEIRRTIAEGNAGNQIKNYRGPFLLEDLIVVGNCGFFDGKPFTYNVDNCRAFGAALAIGLTKGNQATVINNTFTSEGDCLVTAECRDGSCDGTETALLRNNIFQGQVDFLQPFEKTCLVYQETFPSDPFDMDYSLVNNVKDVRARARMIFAALPPAWSELAWIPSTPTYCKIARPLMQATTPFVTPPITAASHAHRMAIKTEPPFVIWAPSNSSLALQPLSSQLARRMAGFSNLLKQTIWAVR